MLSAHGVTKKPRRYRPATAARIKLDKPVTWPAFTERDRELIERFLFALRIQAENGLVSTQAMWEASGRDPAMRNQVDHFAGYIKAFNWALLRVKQRQFCLAELVLSGRPYPEL